MRYPLAFLAAFILPLSAAPLSGTYSIGPTGTYASLTAAIADVKLQGMNASVVLELQASYMSSVETFPLTVGGAGGLPTTMVNTLTIRPASGATALSISSANTTAATLDLNGAQFLRIDGRPGGVGTAKELTIANTNTSGVAVRFINEASENVLSFLIVQGVNTSATGGTSVFSTTTGVNGNDNNTIDQCDLRDGATTPANALYSLGSNGNVAQRNSGNTVSNCNIFNFYAETAVDVTGVRLDSGNTDWNIIGNSFYQTSDRVAVASNVRAIFINNPSGNNFTITGNFIGGTAPRAGSTAWATLGTSAAYRFQGIRLNVGTTGSSNAQGNTIQNIAWTTSSNDTTQSGIWCGIYVQSGRVNIGTATGNTIGRSTGTESVSVTTSGTGGTSFGIRSESSSPVAITNNTIGSITTSGSGTTVSASLVGIQVSAGANTIVGNNIGSTATAYSLNAVTSSTSTAGQQVTGIFSSSSASTSITGNTVANLNNSYAGNASAGQIRGIATSEGVNTITGNTVRSLLTTNQNTGRTTSSSVLGIIQTSPVAGQTVSRNVVHSLANTTSAPPVSVIGIYYAGTSTGSNLIARNLVHSLAIFSTSTSSVLCGMYFNSGTFTAQNNMVRVGLDASGNTTAGASQLSGIFDGSSTTGRRFYHNSVYVGGNQTSGSNSTYALMSSGTSNTRNFTNNIFANARNNSGIGNSTHYAVQYGGNSAWPTGLTASNNLYFVNGTGGVLGTFAGLDRPTLAAWQLATRVDSASLNADPLFISASGTATSVDLHAQIASPVSNGGSSFPQVSDDFDGQARNSMFPNIGADEFDPANVANLSSIAVSDGARFSPSFAINTLIYRICVASTATSITVTPSLINPLTTVTVNGGNPAIPVSLNLGSNRITILVTAQDGITTKTYTLVVIKLGGTLSIGPTGDYPSITQILSDIRMKSLAGPLTLELQPAYLSSVETLPLVFNNLNTTATNTLTLRPQSGATGLSIYSDYLVTVDLLGTKFMTIDGRPGGVGTAKELTIGNTRTEGVAVRFIHEASENTLRHLTLRGVNTQETTSFYNSSGVVFFSSNTGVNGNDNNTLDSCDIRDGATTPTNAIYSEGSASTPEQNNSGNTVSNCNIFNFYSANENASGVCLDDGNTDWTISGNSFYQTTARAQSSGYVRPISISGSGSQFNIIGNFIGGSEPKAEGLPWKTDGGLGLSIFEGIRLNTGSGSVGNVQGNTIRNMVWNSSGASSNNTPWTGIRIGLDPNQYFGSLSSCAVTGNTIGASTGTNSVVVNSSDSFEIIFGILFQTNALGTISDNCIGGINTNVSLSGIKASGETINIANNVVGSTTTANSLNGGTLSGPVQVTGIENSSHVATITGNTVANLNNNYAGTSTSDRISGIVTTTNDANTVSTNLVRNLSTASANPGRVGFGPGITPSMQGISVTSSSPSLTVFKNTIHSLSNTATSASVQGAGIYCMGGENNGTSVIAGNRVHSLSIFSTSESSKLYGMYLGRGNFNTQNNMVRVGLDASGVSTAGASTVSGIFDNGRTAGRNFYHNSVYVGGTQISGQSITSAFSSGAWSIGRVFRNNIFVNARTNSGATSKHYAAGYTDDVRGASFVHGQTANANHNIYLVSGIGGVLGYYFGDYSTLAAWQVGTGQDISSTVADPLFVNPTGTTATVDLHLRSSTPADGGGLPIVSVTDDYDGDTRSLTAPDIGADELRPPFQQWAQSNAVGNDPITPGANGLANLLNFAFALNPNTSSRNALGHTGNVITPGSISLELLSGTPTAKFIRRADYVAAGLTYTTQFSANLSTWVTDTTPPSLFATDGINQVAGLTYPVLPGGAQARFFRVIVSLQ